MELFPTNVRQSGIGFATLISQTISIGGPYTIYLGQYDLKLPYVIMFLSRFFLWIWMSHLTQVVSPESTMFTFGKSKRKRIDLGVFMNIDTFYTTEMPLGFKIRVYK